MRHRQPPAKSGRPAGAHSGIGAGPKGAFRLSQGRALLLVFDGLGFSRDREREVCSHAWRSLPNPSRKQLLELAGDAAERNPRSGFDGPDLARFALYPVAAQVLASDMPAQRARATLAALKSMRVTMGRTVQTAIERAVHDAALACRYVPWVAATPFLDSVRNDHVTIPTHTAGKWVGFEDLNPPVQGNSDTGHQQIANLQMAPQIPLEITTAVESGAFFRNPALLAALRHASNGGTLNFCFMISGVAGHDGRVHSAWNHLDAFLKLIFEIVKLTPAHVRMQAVLDGRDCPGDSSIKAYDGVGNYLGRLEKSLARYGAQPSLAWIVGRNIAMDRDYREASARADFLMLTKAEGRPVEGFPGVRASIAEAHASGLSDTDIPPLVVTFNNGERRTVDRGSVFVNLNYRADRQRAKTASLLGARPFLVSMSAERNRPWKLDWLDDSLNLHVCTIVDYHSDLATSGAQVAFPADPQPDNLLSLFPSLLPGETYSLVGESNKGSHMGFFIRGRREAPVADGIERRTIVPSAAGAEDIHSDSDFYKTPAMRSREIADIVVERMSEGRDRLVCANLANCDMLGHLLPGRFDAAVRACEAVDAAARQIIPAAGAAGYDAVLTSDHGNIEDDTPSHSVNDVLTTVVPASGRAFPAVADTYQARLYDVSWTVARFLGVDAAAAQHLEERGGYHPSDERFGRPLVDLRRQP